ncbi:hypothetical protein [Streptomyces sp. NPDC048644]|uniref:hypothetical protein n=1 Tax=Streptomyces sp. NPDC048644 TaxID=3365582 RepID=UPI00372402C2
MPTAASSGLLCPAHIRRQAPSGDDGEATAQQRAAFAFGHSAPPPPRAATGAAIAAPALTRSASAARSAVGSGTPGGPGFKAINAAKRADTAISVSGIARQAGVDRAFLYRHKDLLAQVHAAGAEPPGDNTGASVSRASHQTDLANALDRGNRLAARVRHLETKLSELLGEQAWRQSGLGAPDGIEELESRITALKQQVTDLTGQLEERDEELQAARAANRQLTSRLNTARPQKRDCP